MSTDEGLIEALFDISKSLRLLGNGNISRADTNPGAIEGLAMKIDDSAKVVASGLDNIADAIRELAQAIGESK